MPNSARLSPRAEQIRQHPDRESGSAGRAGAEKLSICRFARGRQARGADLHLGRHR
jgi:hypothetical protein